MALLSSWFLYCGNIISNSLPFPLSFASHTESGVGNPWRLVGFGKMGGNSNSVVVTFNWVAAVYTRGVLYDSGIAVSKCGAPLALCHSFSLTIPLFLFFTGSGYSPVYRHKVTFFVSFYFCLPPNINFSSPPFPLSIPIHIESCAGDH